MKGLTQTQCSYCSSQYGTRVRYHGRIRTLEEHTDHFYPHAARGYYKRDSGDTSCCQICNAIKGAKVFEDMLDAQLYILDRLSESDWMIIEESPIGKQGL